jgi:hypothetical protein
MSKLITALKMIAALLPVLFDIVRAVEAALPQSGAGAQKLAMVRELLERYWATATEIGMKFAEAWPFLESAIAGVVALLNRSGEFKTAPKA